jgi:hypothetical protein
MGTTITPTSFNYIELPSLRFIGIDAWRTQEDWGDMWRRKDEFLPQLDALRDRLSPALPDICAFMHHDDGEVDVINRMIIGRFYEADTPVPQGYDYHDIQPQVVAYAVYDNMTYDNLWQRYECTRDRILGEGITIPYPVGYWHAEVYYDKTPMIEENDPPFRCGVLFATNKEKREGNPLLDAFYWSDIDFEAEQTPADKYGQFIRWAGNARGRNPNAFDKITEWLLCDSEWTEDKLAKNKDILMNGLLARFKSQTMQIRAGLKELEPHGVVNEAVWERLDIFEGALSGESDDRNFNASAAKIFTDFSVMKDRGIREQIAGGKTGPAGVDTVGIYGFVNALKDKDAAVQWALFMPQVVENQQKGFKIASFEYKSMPAMRLVGKEVDWTDDGWGADVDGIFDTLDTITGYNSGFDYDVCFMHHFGKGVDVERLHNFWGRFMRADCPVPAGLESIDFIQYFDDTPGFPYGSQFAFAVFEGDIAAMHESEGYDCDAMYDVTRNTMLGQSVTIPYPPKYWTAEVFLNGHKEPSTAFMFSADF